MITKLLLTLIVIIGIPVYCEDVCPGYDACPKYDNDALNVHIVAHSHDDVGWVKTVTQYYDHSVNSIITTAMASLNKNPERKFIQVETAFFHMWWQQQNETTKDLVKKFVLNGQLEIIGGAWSMNDEAAAHYQSIVDQFTLGLRVIDDTLGPCARPKIGWQIDPFGHSKEMASLFAQFGYDAFFFGRLDFRDKEERINTKTTEIIWQGSSNLGNDSNIFTSVLYNLYQPPKGFCFDIECSDRISKDNKDSKVADFTKIVLEQAKAYPTNNILITMGGDFTYTNAETFFGQLDFLIKAMEESQSKTKDGKLIKVFYSTPSCYVNAVQDAAKTNKLNFKLKTDDFLPYANAEHSYWTGFFSSRPTSKRYEREGNNLLQITKQLAVLDNPDTIDDIFELQKGMGIMQHHDAITGTEKQYVANDYAKIMSDARTLAVSEDGKRLINLLNKTIEDISLNFESCPLTNISICATSNKKEFVVALYNPLGKEISQHVRLAVDNTNYIITNFEGKQIQYQTAPAIRDFNLLYKHKKILQYDLVFLAENIPPLGSLVFHVKQTGDKQKPTKAAKTYLGTEDFGFTISSNGLLESVTKNGLTINVKQKLMYYNSHSGSNMGSDRSSGAYCFSPDGDAKDFDDIKYAVYKGDIFDEVKQDFGGWATQSIRVYKDLKYIEFDWVVGVIDMRGNGKEVISRFETELESGEVFYTDSNGRETIKRIRDYRETYKFAAEEPATGNYYPVTSHLSIEDVKNDLYFTIFNDRAQGGSSIASGEMELMLHRRTSRDDSWSVGEALNEKEVNMGAVARGQIIIDFGKIEDKQDHKTSRNNLLKPWTFLAETSESYEEISSKMNFKFAGLRKNLPDDVHLMTLEPWKNGSVLIRLEHISEQSETIVDLNNLFNYINITSLEEMTLAANQPISEKKRLDWTIGEHLNPKAQYTKTDYLKENIYDDTLQVMLKPMQIRTFIASVTNNNSPVEFIRTKNYYSKMIALRSHASIINWSFGLLIINVIYSLCFF